jgi:hypothetical protein
VRSLLFLLGSLVSAVGVFVAGMAFTAYLIAEPEGHRFANLETPDLWTSKPVVIDAAGQDYERIGAVISAGSIPASGPIGEDSRETAGSSRPLGAPTFSGLPDDHAGLDAAKAREREVAAPAMDPAHVEWCFDRYRSYSPEDDSYQPYGGGERQRCESPWTPLPTAAIDNADAVDAEVSVGAMPEGAFGEEKSGPQKGPTLLAVDEQHSPADTAGMAPVGAHEEWCYSRYRSYSVDSNTYQPFDGGPRRSCSSPYG